MKIFRILLGVMLFMSSFAVNEISAKGKVVPDVYIFGFSASFQDSIVFVTEIQKLDSAWIDTKTKFLMSRENYSYQLKNYLSKTYQMPHRTCIVMFATKKKDIEKKYAQLMNKYVANKKNIKYDVRVLEPKNFKFEYIDMSYDEGYNNAE